MNHTSTISRLLIVPGLAAKSGRLAQNTHFQTVSIGLVIDGARVVWGNYQGHHDADVALTLQEKVAPVLEGRSLNAHRTIMETLDGLSETAVITQLRAQPLTDAISRRSFLTGKLETAAQTEQVTVERPLQAAIRYAVSKTLLSALASTRGLTVTELIAAEYNLPLPPSPVPLHLDINSDSLTPDTLILSPQIQSLGYRLTGKNPKKQLGSNGEKLQRFIRQLTQVIDRVTEPDYRPTIHLDVGGGLGELFDADAGRILGALYGLEQAAKPYPLCIADPLARDETTQQVKIMRQLMDYIRLRKMEVKLAANHAILSPTDVRHFIEAGAAHILELSLPQLGTVQQSIKAVQACRQAGVAVLMRDDVSQEPFASHVALATQPDSIGVAWDTHERRRLDQIYGEMAQTVAWINQHKDKNGGAG